MTSDAVWRLGFVLGLFSAAVVGVVMYGDRPVLPIIAVCAALTPVINGILGAAPGQRPYLERVVRSALSAGWFFRLVTICAWMCVVGMGAISFAHHWHP
ncbi:MAG TPA: hypothetical protein VF219_14350, partial [Vicinamibacterales bacterium]